jgi:hypothetical protein
VASAATVERCVAKECRCAKQGSVHEGARDGGDVRFPFEAPNGTRSFSSLDFFDF